MIIMKNILKNVTKMIASCSIFGSTFMFLTFPQTSVPLGVLAALLEDKVCVARPKSVRGNWPLWSPVVRGLQGPLVDDGTDNRYTSKVSNTTLGSKL